MEAKSRAWEVFDEAIEEDFWSTSKRFWQTAQHLRGRLRQLVYTIEMPSIRGVPDMFHWAEASWLTLDKVEGSYFLPSLGMSGDPGGATRSV